MDMKKEWKEIKGYEGKYIVSNYGEVISLPRLKQNNSKKQYVEPKELSKHISSTNGYVYVLLCGKGKCKNVRLHKLVAEAFIPNPEHKEQVNHIDGDKTNNKVENLEWCNNAENIKHAYRTGLTYYTKGRRDNFEKIRIDNSKRVVQMDLSGNEIKIWNSMEEAGKAIGICRSGISECCSGKHRTAGGYRWKYAEK